MIRNNTTGERYEKIIKIPKVWFNAPSNEMLDEYEQLKDRHFGRSLDKAMDRIQKAEDKERKKSGYFPDGSDAHDRSKIKSDTVHAKAMSQILGTTPHHPQDNVYI
jgi:hypothetical protein